MNKIKELLDKGFDPNFVSESGDSPLTYCALNDSADLISLLVQVILIMETMGDETIKAIFQLTAVFVTANLGRRVLGLPRGGLEDTAAQGGYRWPRSRSAAQRRVLQ